VAASQSFTVLSRDPEASVPPLGSNATDYISTYSLQKTGIKLYLHVDINTKSNCID
jgi:hypothetical protein